jgi:nucleoside-diphosphate-sugar epimerase
MRIFITGGTGFIGSAVVHRLIDRGDRVTAVVRDPSHGEELTAIGVDLRQGDLTRSAAIVDAMRGNDAAIHLAGMYRVGINPSERPAMHDANVGATLRVLDAFATAGLDRVVVVSTINVAGNTHGRIVDERYRRDLAEGFLSYYDETKYLAHRAALERIGSGGRIVIAQPGQVYGPGDHSAIGQQIQAAHDGTLPYVSLPELGIAPVFVKDVAAGIVAALDRGRIGESYFLGGQNMRLRDVLKVAAKVGGRRLPPFELPVAVMRLGGKLPASMARAMGFPDDLGEVVRAGLGVTYWGSSAKAATELGYGPRDLASGLRATFDGG